MDTYYVATVDGNIVGMANLDGVPFDQDSDCDMISCMSYRLSDFEIHSDYRKQGVGTRMLQFMLDDLQFYQGLVRVEGHIAPGAYEFWRHATMGMNATFECDIEECSSFEECSHLYLYVYMKPDITATSH